MSSDLPKLGEIDPQRWRKITEVLDRVLELSGDQLSDHLDRACAGDAKLRAHVEALIASDRRAGDFLEQDPRRLNKVLAELAKEQAEGGGHTGLAEFPLPYRRLGDFDIIREIGRGGMGIVCEAQQVSLRRQVALKVLLPSFALSHEGAVRFKREAQAAAKLHHTNIVPVYAIGEQYGYHFYAMELVHGRSLRTVFDELRSGKEPSYLETLTTPRSALGSADGQSREPTDVALTTGSRERFDAVARMLGEVAEALDYAHSHGVIHRDIKPGNLLLSLNGRLSITDFGLALLSQEPSLTISGSLLGTPAYMSPEQIAVGRMKLDHRTDIYSLGVVLYEALTLKPPFSGSTREEIVSGILTRDPRPPRQRNAKIPRDLETICLKALEKDPGQRYQTALQMAHDLGKYLQRDLITARRTGPLRRMVKKVRRHPTATVAVTGIVTLAAIGGLGWYAQTQRVQETVLRDLAEAKFQMSEGSSREALELADKALARAPGQLETRLLRARLLIELGRPQEAVSDARLILENEPNAWPAHLVLAAAAGSVPDVSREEHVEMVRALAPESAEAYYLRSLLAGSKAEAMDLLDKAVTLDPGHVQTLEARGALHIAMKDFRDASMDVASLIASRPRSPQARILNARIQNELHDYQQALKQIDLAIALDPQDPRSYVLKSQILEECGIEHRDEAITEATKAIDLEPTNPRYLERRASFYLDFDQYEEALADAKRCLDLDPGPEIAWRAYDVAIRSLVWLKKKDEALEVLEEYESQIALWTDAKLKATAYRNVVNLCLGFLTDTGSKRTLEVANKAVEADPSGWKNYICRARAIAKLEEAAEAAEPDLALANSFDLQDPGELYSRALEMWEFPHADWTLRDLEGAVALAPSWAEPYGWRGFVTFWQTRDETRLFADYDRQIELAPMWAQAYAKRGNAYLRWDRYEEALADFDKCIQLAEQGYPGASIYGPRAQALLKLGRDDESLLALDEGIRFSPRTYGFMVYRAVFLNDIGRKDEAIAAIDSAIHMMPGNSMNYTIRARVLLGRPNSCAEALVDLEKSKEGPQRANLLNVVAWIHALYLFQDCPDLYDGATALELARRNVDYCPDCSPYLRVLGLVLYRHARYSEAEQVLLSAGDYERNAYVHEEPETLFCLAMSVWRLGREADALAHFNQAVAYMKDQHRYSFVERYRLMREAAQLVGVPPPL